MSSARRKNLSAAKGLSLLFVASLLFLVPLVLHAAGSTQPQQSAPIGMRPAVASSAAGAPAQGLPFPNYDEQLGTTFTQSFSSMAYNVTALAQEDSEGYGPAYLLNGLSSNGYWYQVGVSYHWPFEYQNGSGGYSPEFNMNYEVFNPRQVSIFPTNGGGGLGNFTGTVNSGDTVLLQLYFSGGNVVMSAEDLDTGATCSITFSAEGASSFVGLTGFVANSNGYFTGLMTEWYHVSAYYGNEQGVTYSDPSTTITSAWLWMDEYNPSTGQAQFAAETPSPDVYTVPTQLQEFSSNGATEYGDAYEFITGATPTNTLTFSYTVDGGGSGYSAPVLTYVTGGDQETATLTTSPTTYTVDPNSQWSVTSTLQGSSSTERWTTGQTTTGTATSAETVVFEYYNQYQVSFAYSVLAGSGYTAPTIAYDSLGSGESTGPGTSVWADAASSYNYTDPLGGSTSSQRWDSDSASGSIGAAQQIEATYYQQYDVAVSVTALGGNPPSGTSISGTEFGAAATSQIALGSSSVWLDSGSSYSLANPAPGSTSSERWYAQSSVSGTVSPGLSISATYYHQFSEAVSYSVAGGGQGPGQPSLNYTSLGAAQSATVTTTPTSYWVDAGSQLKLSSDLPGSSASERWAQLQGTSPTVSSSGAVAVVYYQQYLTGFDYSVVGGGSGYSAPSVNFTQFGTPTSVETNGSAWVDAGSSYSYPATLSGSGQTERWYATAPGGTISSAESLDVSYYHQFLATATYTGAESAPQVPELSYVSMGTPVQVELNSATSAQAWIDAGTQYSVTNPLGGSSSQERWEAPSGTNGTVSGAIAISPSYFQQYLTEVSYSVVGGGNPGAPQLNASIFGVATPTTLTGKPTPLWLDADSTYTLSGTLPTSTNVDRWITNSSAYDVITGPGSIAPQYVREYYIALQPSTAAGGSVSVAPGWFDAGAVVSVVASPASGWAFQSWTGNGSAFSGAGATVSFSASAPVNETAVFYPGLTITAGSSASVSYSVGSIQGTVPAGSSSVVYVPPASEVTLKAVPGSILYSFDHWSGASSASSPEVVISVATPQTIDAISGYDYPFIAGILVVVVVLIVGIVLALSRRSKNPSA